MSYVDPGTFGTPATGGKVKSGWGVAVQGDIQLFQRWFSSGLVASGSAGTDTAAINSLLAGGVCILAPNSTFYFNAQLVGPQSGPGLLWIPKSTTLQLAANTRLTKPAIVPYQWTQGGTPSAAQGINFDIMGGGILDLNAGNQNWTGAESWLTASMTTIIGPDGPVLATTESTIDVQVINATRHAITCAGANSAGTQSSTVIYGSRLGSQCRVWGWEANNSVVTSTGCTTSAGTNTATLGTNSANVQIGMYCYGQGILPGTIVTNVVGTALTLNQNVGVNPGTALNFSFSCGAKLWIQTNNTDGWVDPNVEMAFSGGAWGVQADSSGGWRFNSFQVWSNAYGGGTLGAENQTVVNAPTFANMGHEIAATVGIATLNGNLAVGNRGTLTVNAIPCALPKNTPIVVPGGGTGGAPLVTALSSAVAAAATSLPVYQLQVQTQVSSGGQINYEMVGLQRVGNPNGSNSDVGALVYQIEKAGSDICYHQWISPNLAGALIAYQSVPGAVATNNSAANASTSVAFSFVSQGSGGQFIIPGLQTLVAQGQPAPVTFMTTAGPSPVILSTQQQLNLVLNPVPSATLNTNGSAVAITLPAMCPGVIFQSMYWVPNGTGSETLTLTFTPTYSDGTTGSTYSPTGQLGNAATVNPSVSSLIGGFVKSGVYITGISCTVKSTINSSTATPAVNLVLTTVA